jgi:hypothetical protein
MMRRCRWYEQAAGAVVLWLLVPVFFAWVLWDYYVAHMAVRPRDRRK